MIEFIELNLQSCYTYFCFLPTRGGGGREQEKKKNILNILYILTIELIELGVWVMRNTHDPHR